MRDHPNAMISKQLLIKALPGVALLTLLVLLLFLFMHDQRETAREAAVKSYIEVHVQDTLKARSARVAQILSAVYENARMVSLLPGVRAIQGGNRKSDTEDVVTEGRFSRHDYEVVQQIYNNLASAVSVSEIYIVLNDFDAQKGHVPFLMLDQLIIGDRGTGDEAESVVNKDIPEESEADEYAFFPQQLQDLKHRFPGFSYDKLDQVPMLASPVMRTCDNTQYPSISQGDVRNAGGILFSVPIYNTNKQIIGLVSVVVRANVFEASIVDVPYLIVTDEDAARASQEQWKMPPVSALKLSNPDYGVEIYDRRNDSMASSATGSENSTLQEHQVKVQSPLGMRWNLSYRVDPAKVQNIVRQSDRKYDWPQAFTVVIYLLLVGGFLFYVNIRMFLERLRRLLSSLRTLAGGDLHVVIPYQHIKGEIGEISQALHTMQATALSASESVWVRKTLSEVDAAVQSAVSFLDFGNALASALQRSIAFDYFALYLFDKHRQGVQRYGGFACNDNIHASYFPIGEGLVGQVAADGRRMHLSQDANHDLHVQTATMSLPVQHLLISAISKSGKVLGVIEVGSLQPLRNLDVDLLNDLLPVLADKIEILQGHIEMRELVLNQ